MTQCHHHAPLHPDAQSQLLKHHALRFQYSSTLVPHRHPHKDCIQKMVHAHQAGLLTGMPHSQLPPAAGAPQTGRCV